MGLPDGHTEQALILDVDNMYVEMICERSHVNEAEKRSGCLRTIARLIVHKEPEHAWTEAPFLAD